MHDLDPTATRVKICGTTRLSDAQLAVELGAWAIGMIFWDRSPRSCALTDADEISRHLRRSVELFGVFVNERLDRIAQLAEELHLSTIQLHGDEGPSFCAEVARRTGAKVCKAAQVSAAGDVRALHRFHVDYHLVDAKGAPGQRGGTGETFDWTLLRRSARREATPLILSGGLNAGNVAAAIETAQPFAVDVASGVEAAPGLKDERLLREFFAAVGVAHSPTRRDGAPHSPDRRDGVARSPDEAAA